MNIIDNMDFNYMKKIRKLYETSSNLLEVVFILGNNTCDMDSALSAYMLSIGKNIQKGTITLDKKGNPSLNYNSRVVYIPVLNIKRGTLPYRLEVKYAFDRSGLDENDFWYISDEIFNPYKLFQHKISSKNVKTSLILVDHTILIEEQGYLSGYVTGIYDHHLLSFYNGQYKNLRKLNILYPVGSCTTLILNEFFIDDDFPVKILSPLLAVSAILLDTKKFKDEFYRNRWADLDKKVYKIIKKVVKKEDKKIKMKQYYSKMKELKHEIEKNLNLGFGALLSKDQKYFYWNNRQKAVWSSLHIPYEEIRKRFGDKSVINHYLDFYKWKANSYEERKNTYFITNSPLGDKQRLFTIFNPIKFPLNKEYIRNELMKHSAKYFYSVDVNQVFGENNMPAGEICYIVVDHIYSRKSFEPILKYFFSNIQN